MLGMRREQQTQLRRSEQRVLGMRREQQTTTQNIYISRPAWFTSNIIMSPNRNLFAESPSTTIYGAANEALINFFDSCCISAEADAPKMTAILAGNSYCRNCYLHW